MASERKKVARWRRRIMRLGSKIIELRLGGKSLITVMTSRDSGCFWYGLGKNSAEENRYFPSLDEAKADADAWFKTHGKDLINVQS